MENLENKGMGEIKSKWKTKKFNISIIVRTGLHIGGTEQEYEIGGLDNPVVKKIDGMPYIPGSSLKGKLRAIVDEEGSEDVRILFGSSNKENPQKDNDKERFCYVIFRDLDIDEEGTKGKLGIYYEEAKRRNFTEIKTENKIKTKSGKAEHPRPMERVIPGVVFKGEIIVKYKSDKKEQINKALEKLSKAIDTLSKYDYLGGCGTRGYGAVEIKMKDESRGEIEELRV